MSKILFVYERNIPTVSLLYELFGDEKIGEYGMDVYFRSIKQIKRADVENCDVLFLIRPNNHFSAGLAKVARRSGRFVITFCDDDLLNLPNHLPNIPWRRRALLRSLSNSHVICSSSNYLCQKYKCKTLSDRYAILNTALSQETLDNLPDVKAMQNDIVKVVYAAGSGHAALFEEYVMPALDVIAENYKDKISLTFVGVRPNVKRLESKMIIRYIDSMPLAKYRQLMLDENFDLGVAPLHDDDFSKCKYFNKFIEYTLSGIVGIYSNLEPYTFVVENEKNGFLANNDAQSWADAIKIAVDNFELRRQCLYNACQKLKDEFNLFCILKQFISDIPELKVYEASQKSSSIGFAKFKYKIFRPLDLIYSALFSLFHGGIRELIKKWKMRNMEKKINIEIEVKK